MAAYTLYGHPRSGNAYKTALMLSMTATPFDFELVDITDGSNLNADYLAVNPLGKVPVLVHGELVLRQSHDTLRYLSQQTGRFGPSGWAEEARVGDWIGYSQDFLGFGVARLRFERLFSDSNPTLLGFFQKAADRGMSIVERHLADNEWLACSRPTIADIACFPVLTYLEDAGYDPADWPRTVAWMERFRSLPGYAERIELMPAEGW